MAVNKVVYGTTVLVDLTEDTVTPQTLLLGNRAHGADGQIVNGTLTGSETGILVKLPGLSATYASSTSVTINISGKTSIYRDITADQIIVEFTHWGLYGSGLVFGGVIDADVAMSYNASTGVITLTTSSTAFNNSYTCKLCLSFLLSKFAQLIVPYPDVDRQNREYGDYYGDSYYWSKRR